MLWYHLFTESLQKMGFVLNPYNPCIANCIIEGSQCTVAWYIDENKILPHVNPDVVTTIVENIEEQFDKMTVTRGRKQQNTTVISMKEYLCESIIESNLNIVREAATTATRELFEVNEKSTRWLVGGPPLFHSVVSKLLYVTIRARMVCCWPLDFYAREYPRVPLKTKKTPATTQGAYARSGQPIPNEVVDGRIVCGSPRHEESHRRCNIVWKR